MRDTEAGVKEPHPSRKGTMGWRQRDRKEGMKKGREGGREGGSNISKYGLL